MRDLNKRCQPSDCFLSRTEQLFSSPSDPLTQHNKARLGINQLCAELTALLKLEVQDPTVKARLLDLMQSARTFDLGYERWSQELPAEWQYQDIEPWLGATNRTSSMDSTSRPIHLYQNLWFASSRNYYRLSLIILHIILLQGAKKLGITNWSTEMSSDTAQPIHDAERSMRLIHALKAEICASIPFCVGKIDSHGNLMPNMPGNAVGGYFTLWPLMHMYSCEYSTAQQVRDAAAALEYIGRVLGIKRAIVGLQGRDRNIDESRPLFKPEHPVGSRSPSYFSSPGTVCGVVNHSC